MNKYCGKCRTSKDVEEFNKKARNEDGLQHNCRECDNAASKVHYNNNKQYYLDKSKAQRDRLKIFSDRVKSRCKCKDCGEGRPWVLDFHHLGNKESGVSKLVNDGVSSTKLKKEMRKCVVLCANCHRHTHYVEMV